MAQWFPASMLGTPPCMEIGICWGNSAFSKSHGIQLVGMGRYGFLPQDAWLKDSAPFSTNTPVLTSAEGEVMVSGLVPSAFPILNHWECWIHAKHSEGSAALRNPDFASFGMLQHHWYLGQPRTPDSTECQVFSLDCPG